MTCSDGLVALIVWLIFSFAVYGLISIATEERLYSTQYDLALHACEKNEGLLFVELDRFPIEAHCVNGAMFRIMHDE